MLLSIINISISITFFSTNNVVIFLMWKRGEADEGERKEAI